MPPRQSESASCRFAIRHEVSARREPVAAACDYFVLERARAEGWVLASADIDFGAILTRSHATRPSFLLLRRAASRRVLAQAAIILDNFDAVEADLDAGAVVVLGETTLRIHRRLIGSDWHPASAPSQTALNPLLELSRAVARYVQTAGAITPTTNDNQHNPPVHEIAVRMLQR